MRGVVVRTAWCGRRMVMEFCDRGTVQDAIDRGWLRTERDCLRSEVRAPRHTRCGSPSLSPCPSPSYAALGEAPAASAARRRWLLLVGCCWPTAPQANWLGVVATAYDIASAMQYLHAHDVVHGDLTGARAPSSCCPVARRPPALLPAACLAASPVTAGLSCCPTRCDVVTFPRVCVRRVERDAELLWCRQHAGPARLRGQGGRLWPQPLHGDAHHHPDQDVRHALAHAPRGRRGAQHALVCVCVCGICICLDTSAGPEPSYRAYQMSRGTAAHGQEHKTKDQANP